MKKNRKINADKDLANEQLPELNKEFYSNYMGNYYFLKSQNLLFIITHTSEYQKSIENCDIEIGRATCRLGGAGDEELKKYAKLEMATTYYHCLETFIRLFIAHAKLEACPWMEMSKLTQRKYKEALDKLSKGNFRWLNDKFDDYNTILRVFMGRTQLPEKPVKFVKEDIEGLKNWIIFACNELLGTYAYNSFKHGLTVYTDTTGFKLGDKESTKIEKHGECLQFLSTKEKEERYVWVKETVFISYDSRSAIFWIFSHLINNILAVGKHKYVEPHSTYKLDFTPKHELTPQFVVGEKGPINVKGFSIELLYKKDDKNIK